MQQNLYENRSIWVFMRFYPRALPLQIKNRSLYRNGLLALVRCIGQQRNVARTLYSNGQLALMLCAIA